MLTSLQACHASKPNIILYLADDLGIGEVNQQSPQWAVYDDVDFDTTIEEDKIIYTPQLERLAREGVRMTRSYTSSPVCGPARYALLTGTPTGASEMRGNNLIPGNEFPLPADQATLPRMLKEQGYWTMAVGKYGLGTEDSVGAPWKQGFDQFYGFLTHAEAHRVFPSSLWKADDGEYEQIAFTQNEKASEARCTCEFGSSDCELDPFTGLLQNSKRCDNANMLFRHQAMEYIDTHMEMRPDQPFFLYYACIATHNGFYNPTGSAKRLQTSPVSTYGRYTDLVNQGMSTGRVGHLAAITHEMDANVGVLLDALERHGIRDDTIFVFSSDNGPHVSLGTDSSYSTDTFKSTMNLKGHKREIYEGGIRAPTIISWPKHLAEGSVSQVPHVHYDLVLTLAGLIGLEDDDVALEPFQNLGAASFHNSLLDGSDASSRSWMHAEICTSNRVDSSKGCDFAFFDMRNSDRTLKLVRDAYTYKLFDLGQDPKEEEDLRLIEPDTYASTLGFFSDGRFRTNYCKYSSRECQEPTPPPTLAPTPHPTAPTRAPNPTPAPTFLFIRVPNSDPYGIRENYAAENRRCAASPSAVTEAETPKDCFDACAEADTCKVFDFAPSTQKCRLFANTCSETDVDASGIDVYDFDSVLTGFASPKRRCKLRKGLLRRFKAERGDCLRACADDDRCEHFSYQTQRRKCFLFRACAEQSRRGFELYAMADLLP
ncbi:Arylsulfatase [Hondaea fermentalgiana]|uniref:Arylsulfatase n=1 Tax=Hondaea fermentalgiana TaxID=2315210 RepID=A0A2R5GCH5_9STRA|nr:Arylsulfatase [Hondaea fermentalgiana]|eukprot:GBG28662.1 Arylsulfatase [Hondaea fermentalgiana]